MSSYNYGKQHVHRFSDCKIAIVPIDEPILVTVWQILKFLDPVHLDPDPMHHIDDVFESIKYNGVLFVFFLALCDLLRTQTLFFLFLLFQFINERFDSAWLRVV